jgi:alpha-tubulin suppressor-like RCC1 family protein
MSSLLGRSAGVFIIIAAICSGPVEADRNETSLNDPNITNQSSITTGGSHSCLLTGAGAVKCWGDNTYGQLGDNTTTSSLIPVDVYGLSDAAAISAGDVHTCALLSTGSVKCWGDMSGISWGMGDGGDTSLVPLAIQGITNAIAISAGGDHTCALLTTGAVRCWGINSAGQLGDNTTTSRVGPSEVFQLTSAIAISVEGSSSCALLSTGAVKCWGSNGSGQLGDNSYNRRLVPVDVFGLTNATAISGGPSHRCALLATGAVKCWGLNAIGQLGDNTILNKRVPVDVFGLTNATAISAGDVHTCALLSTGSVKCWGDNSTGQLGDNTTTSSLIPVDVFGLTNANALSSGYFHSCALTTTGATKCWGGNTSGQLGDNSSTRSLVPVDVFGFGSVSTSTTTPSVTTTPPVTTTPSVTTTVGDLRTVTLVPPASLSYQAGNQKITLRWSAVEDAEHYLVINSSGSQVCKTIITSCKVNRLTNGKSYFIRVFSVTADGKRSRESVSILAYSGFQVRNTSFRSGSVVSLASIVSTPSKGRKSWSVSSGSCRILGKLFVAAPKRGTCRLHLATIKSADYSAMSTSFKITVTR